MTESRLDPYNHFVVEGLYAKYKRTRTKSLWPTITHDYNKNHLGPNDMLFRSDKLRSRFFRTRKKQSVQSIILKHNQLGINQNIKLDPPTLNNGHKFNTGVPTEVERYRMLESSTESDIEVYEIPKKYKIRKTIVVIDPDDFV